MSKLTSSSALNSSYPLDRNKFTKAPRKLEIFSWGPPARLDSAKRVGEVKMRKVLETPSTLMAVSVGLGFSDFVTISLVISCLNLANNSPIVYFALYKAKYSLLTEKLKFDSINLQWHPAREAPRLRESGAVCLFRLQKTYHCIEYLIKIMFIYDS